MNLFPALRFSGARVTHYAGDSSEIRAELRLGLCNRNVVGTIFGGALYTLADPFYMLLLIDRLGAEHVVWDKAATIRFLKPGRSTLYARFVITDEEVAEILGLLESEASVDRVYRCDLVDESGTPHAEVDKVVYIRRRDPDRDGAVR